MRLAIFSDTHANLEALSAVLEAYRRESIDVYYCLGDTVGYGGSPNECATIVRELASKTILGNHDAAVSGRMDYSYYYEAARHALDAHASMVTAENMAWLKSLPYEHMLSEHGVLLCHGSPVRLEEFEYIFAPEQARECLGIYDRLGHITLIGHSHLCKVFALTRTSVEELPSNDFELDPDKKYIVSVGSVGQPRDFDNRASFTVFDTDKRRFEFKRIEYDIELAAQKVLTARLEKNFAHRLYIGVCRVARAALAEDGGGRLLVKGEGTDAAIWACISLNIDAVFPSQPAEPDMEDKNRSKAIDLAVASIEKEYGKGSIMRLKEGQTLTPDTPVIPSGSIGLDLALGIGGYPRGRIIEVYGPESSGKTTLTLHAIASVQKQGGVAAFIDAEHALDPAYARKLGVKTDELLISQPDFGEQALEIADMLVRSGAVDIIVIDSVAALVPKAEIEGDMGDSHVGTQARLMSQALRKLTSTVAKSNCLLVFINQIRMKIGVMFGSPETTTGGNALKFYASVRLDIRRIGAIKEAAAATDKKDPVVVGNRTRVKVVKNKMAPPFREVEFDILYGQGISRAGDVIDLASDLNLVEKSGAWYSYGGERIGQGRENAKAYLEQHTEIMDKLEVAILAKHGIKRLPAIPVAANGVAESDEKPKRVASVQAKPAN